MAKKRAVLLRVSEVSKKFGTHQAVASASFQVSAGEIVGFLGPNGAGKTTTIRMLMQEIRPTTGEIEMFGTKNTPSSANHRDIGFLGSDMTYEHGLTGKQYLNLVNNLRGGTHTARISELATQLEAELDRKISTLSRGNKQKIGLIAALMHQPKLLIMDEPTSGFDPLMQQVFLDIIRHHAASGGAALISSHILGEIQHLADRVVFITEGQVIGEKDIKSLLRDSPLRLKVSFSSRAKAQTAAKELTKSLNLTIETYQGAQLEASYRGNITPLLAKLAQLKPTQCLIEESELEDVFMQYYQQTENSL